MIPSDIAASSLPGYWQSRQSLIYYQYVDSIVRGVAFDAKSIIDIGSSNTSIIEQFDWAEIRHTLDFDTPYSSRNVIGIRQDFLEFAPAAVYDLGVCLQVLEHIPDVEHFAQKLFEVARAVLISVPYEWPKGRCKHHIHDPVGIEKLRAWTKRKPDYQIVVKEPLTNSATARRLIAYYHESGKTFSLSNSRNNLKRSMANTSALEAE